MIVNHFSATNNDFFEGVTKDKRPSELDKIINISRENIYIVVTPVVLLNVFDNQLDPKAPTSKQKKCVKLSRSKIKKIQHVDIINDNVFNAVKLYIDIYFCYSYK